jgi:hypothetical protein
MVTICGPSGDPDGEEGHQGSHEIEPRMGCFRQDAQASCRQTNDYLEGCKSNRRKNRNQSDRAFFSFSNLSQFHPLISPRIFFRGERPPSEFES